MQNDVPNRAVNRRPGPVPACLQARFRACEKMKLYAHFY